MSEISNAHQAAEQIVDAIAVHTDAQEQLRKARDMYDRADERLVALERKFKEMANRESVYIVNDTADRPAYAVFLMGNDVVTRDIIA